MDFEQVRNIIAESLGCDVEQVTLEAALVDDLGADCLLYTSTLSITGI